MTVAFRAKIGHKVQSGFSGFPCRVSGTGCVSNPTNRSIPDSKDPEAAFDREDRIVIGGMEAHLAFQREIAAMLADADITEEERQAFLIAANCPCCGAGGLSLSLSLRPDTPIRF